MLYNFMAGIIIHMNISWIISYLTRYPFLRHLAHQYPVPNALQGESFLEYLDYLREITKNENLVE